MITLATLPQATEREVFEQVKAHLLTQNEVSKDVYCVYRNKKGLKCAAGCLIGNDEYKQEMEYNNWALLVKKELVPKKHDILISLLQEIHDNFAPSQWEYRLQELETTLK